MIGVHDAGASEVGELAGLVVVGERASRRQARAIKRAKLRADIVDSET